MIDAGWDSTESETARGWTESLTSVHDHLSDLDSAVMMRLPVLTGIQAQLQSECACIRLTKEVSATHVRP
jgi:hypothetical protein